MSDIRFNQWLHQSGTGGVSQVASGAVGVGTTNPLADFYVRGDAQITGILTAGHIAMGSSITFGDDDRAYFGNGTDLQIYHSGSHSFIQDTGTGNLFIDSNSVQIRNAAASKTTAKFMEDAQVELYYNNTERIRTTNTGAVVTGILTATTDLDVDGTATLGQTTIAHTTSPQLIIKDSDTNSPGDLVGVSFRAANNTEYGFIGSPDSTGHTLFIRTVNTVNPIRLQVNSSTRLEVGNTGVFATGTLSATGSLSAGSTLYIPDDIQHTGDSDTKIRFPAADTITAETGGTERLRIESNGDVEWNNIGTPTPGYSNSTEGMGFEPRNGTIFLSRADNLVLHTNRNNDGRIINFSQGGNQKFNIGLKNSGADLAFNSGTSEGTERLRIDSDGRCIVGGGSHAGGSALVVKGGNQNAYSTIGMFSNHTNPANNTLLSQIRFGSNTTAVGADIRVYADAAWGTNDYPSRMEFHTTPDGSNSKQVRLKIDKDGDVTVSTGTLYIPQWISHVGDTDSKFGFLQPDIIQFDTAGSTRLKIMNTGQIRIDQGTSANNGIRMRPSGWNYDFRIGAVSSSGGSIWLGQNYEPTGGTRDSASYGTNYLRFTTQGEILLGTGATDTNPDVRLKITNTGSLIAKGVRGSTVHHVSTADVEIGGRHIWNRIQSSNHATTSSTQQFKIKFFRTSSSNSITSYYRGVVVNVTAAGGYDWSGHGYVTHSSSTILMFSSTTGGSYRHVHNVGYNHINNNANGDNHKISGIAYSYDTNYLYATFSYTTNLSGTGFKPHYNIEVIDPVQCTYDVEAI